MEITTGGRPFALQLFFSEIQKQRDKLEMLELPQHAGKHAFCVVVDINGSGYCLG